MIPLVIALVLLCYFIVFGRSSRFQKIQNARNWITSHNLKTLGYLVPLGYSLVMAYCLFIFDTECAPKLGKFHQNICRVLYLLPFSSMALCVFSDPGKISRQNHYDAMRAFKYDRILYMPHIECKSCHFTKPARSKHCSVCDNCIELLDHHCIWINNCVGRNNYRYFMYFLVAHLFIFGYGLWLLVPMFISGWSRGGSLANKFWGLVRHDRSAVCLALLCFLIGWITVIFTAYTLYFVYLGVTTNEQEKWDDIQDLIDDRSLYIYQLPNEIYNGSIVLQKFADGSYNRRLTNYEQALVDQNHAQLVPVNGFQDLNNIYDLGFWQNLKVLMA